MTVKLRWQGFDTVTRQTTLARPVDTFEGIWPVAVRLLRIADRKKRRVRLVGVTLSGLHRSSAGQLSLFEAEDQHDRRMASAIDALRLRFGRHAVTRAALLEEDG